MKKIDLKSAGLAVKAKVEMLLATFKKQELANAVAAPTKLKITDSPKFVEVKRAMPEVADEFPVEEIK
jgi:hypothetical protein